MLTYKPQNKGLDERPIVPPGSLVNSNLSALYFVHFLKIFTIELNLENSHLITYKLSWRVCGVLLEGLKVNLMFCWSFARGRLQTKTDWIETEINELFSASVRMLLNECCLLEIGGRTLPLRWQVTNYAVVQLISCTYSYSEDFFFFSKYY